MEIHGPDRADVGVTRVEALRYRCLRFTRQAVKPFQLLVGPNASGKSTFLDVIETDRDAGRYRNFPHRALARQYRARSTAYPTHLPSELLIPHLAGTGQQMKPEDLVVPVDSLSRHVPKHPGHVQPRASPRGTRLLVSSG